MRREGARGGWACFARGVTSRGAFGSSRRWRAGGVIGCVCGGLRVESCVWWVGLNERSSPAYGDHTHRVPVLGGLRPRSETCATPHIRRTDPAYRVTIFSVLPPSYLPSLSPAFLIPHSPIQPPPRITPAALERARMRSSRRAPPSGPSPRTILRSPRRSPTWWTGASRWFLAPCDTIDPARALCNTRPMLSTPSSPRSPAPGEWSMPRAATRC